MVPGTHIRTYDVSLGRRQRKRAGDERKIISECQAPFQAYFLDGVAINGVSGGPAFHLLDSQEEPCITGIVSAYIPNVATGSTLPGLSVARNVRQLQDTVKTFKSMDDAAKAQDLLDEASEEDPGTDETS